MQNGEQFERLAIRLLTVGASALSTYGSFTNFLCRFRMQNEYFVVAMHFVCLPQDLMDYLRLLVYLVMYDSG